jgi:hypothetical protein
MRFREMFAKKRCERLGWREACHQTALEVLGYRFNRGPMLAVAAEFPLSRWPGVGEADNLENLHSLFLAHWNRQAIRPANHPKVRLRQYASWTRAVADWPERLLEFAKKLTLESGPQSAMMETARFRRSAGMSNQWEALRLQVCGGAIPGPRFRTLVCDGFLPLLAAAEDEEKNLEAWWFHAFPGDLPQNIRRILAAIELTSGAAQPIGHGIAQGLLSWCWREEEKAHATACS